MISSYYQNFGATSKGIWPTKSDQPGFHQTGSNIPCQLHTITSGLWSKGGWEIHQIRTSMSAGHQWNVENWCFKVVRKQLKTQIWKNTSQEAKDWKICFEMLSQLRCFNSKLSISCAGSCWATLAGDFTSLWITICSLLLHIVDDASVKNYVSWKTTSRNLWRIQHIHFHDCCKPALSNCPWCYVGMFQALIICGHTVTTLSSIQGWSSPTPLGIPWHHGQSPRWQWSLDVHITPATGLLCLAYLWDQSASMIFRFSGEIPNFLMKLWRNLCTWHLSILLGEVDLAQEQSDVTSFQPLCSISQVRTSFWEEVADTKTSTSCQFSTSNCIHPSIHQSNHSPTWLVPFTCTSTFHSWSVLDCKNHSSQNAELALKFTGFPNKKNKRLKIWIVLDVNLSFIQSLLGILGWNQVGSRSVVFLQNSKCHNKFEQISG